MEEREDPLERLERKEREKKENSGLKTVMYALIAVAVLLVAALIYVTSTKNKLVGELNSEKQDLTEQILALQADYEGLSSEYDTINSQLDSSREEIAQLVEKVKKTEATNRAKIRSYEKELGTLRSIMRRLHIPDRFAEHPQPQAHCRSRIGPQGSRIGQKAERRAHTAG